MDKWRLECMLATMCEKAEQEDSSYECTCPDVYAMDDGEALLLYYTLGIPFSD